MSSYQTNKIGDDIYYVRMKSDSDDEPAYNGNGVAYFLAIFASVFEDATNKLQNGETNMTEAMQEITKKINDAKDKKLEADNKAIQDKIDEIKRTQPKGDDLRRAEDEVTKLQSQYKLDDSIFQSEIQAMTPITTTDSDLTTSISQNNNTINQIAMFIINIQKVLGEQLIKFN
jgi:hypothetical protein